MAVKRAMPREYPVWDGRIPVLDLRDAERLDAGLAPLGKTCERCGYEVALFSQPGFGLCPKRGGQRCGMYARKLDRPHWLSRALHPL